MENIDIAASFSLLAKLMELYNENSFKIKAYQNAAQVIKKLDIPLKDMTIMEMESIQGIGKAIASKIDEKMQTNSFELLEEYLNRTPSGIVDLLNIRGLGPKKISTLWQELQIESPGELLYACNENRLTELKGFGVKTQENIKELVEYLLSNADRSYLAASIEIANELVSALQSKYPHEQFEITGQLKRKLPLIDYIEIISTLEIPELTGLTIKKAETKGLMVFKSKTIKWILATPHEFRKTSLLSACSDHWRQELELWDIDERLSEKEIFESNGFSYVVPEYRESPKSIELAKKKMLPELINDEDILGLIHAHSTYSDGSASLKEMAHYVRSAGYKYFVISDHSKAAFYANGMHEATVEKQWKEIDELNRIENDFRLFKGIECDILNDGSLDYSKDFLNGFEVVLASIHSNLKMDEAKATDRLIKAIENPRTHILGHPTGRILLARPGYPIDHKKVIDACAVNQVALELNANPQRLDIDWQWIEYAVSKGVLISINPDAHSMKAVDKLFYGVWMARKAGVTPANCLNCFTVHEFQSWLDSKR
jgi:DNA polymerase (family X)